VWFRHALVENCSASAADVKSQAISHPAVLLEGDQCFIVLPADTDVGAATILASVDGNLACHICGPSVSVFLQNTQYRKKRQIANERSADIENSTKATIPIVVGISATPKSICIDFSSPKYDGVFSCDETFEGTLFLKRPSMCCYYIFCNFNYDFGIRLNGYSGG
jgi:hypothetical protein